MNNETIIYELSGYESEIRKVRVTKRTAKMFEGIYTWRRWDGTEESNTYRRRFDEEQHFDTWEQANAFRIKRAESKINKAKVTIENETANIEQWKSETPK